MIESYCRCPGCGTCSAHDEVAALRKQNAQLIAAIKEAPHEHFCLTDGFRMADGKRANLCNCWKRTALKGIKK